MKTISKYVLELNRTTEEHDLFLELPESAEILSIGAELIHHGEQCCLWAKVQWNDTTKKIRHLKVYGIGQVMHDGNHGSFLGTIILNFDHLAFHFFDCGWKDDEPIESIMIPEKPANIEQALRFAAESEDGNNTPIH